MQVLISGNEVDCQHTEAYHCSLFSFLHP